MVSVGGAAGLGASTRHTAARPGAVRPGSVSTLGPVTPTSISTTRSPISPSSNSGQSPGGQSQHEVLQNFFQSLLSTKDRGVNVSRGTPLNATKTNGTSGTPTTTSNGVTADGS